MSDSALALPNSLETNGDEKIQKEDFLDSNFT